MTIPTLIISIRVITRNVSSLASLRTRLAAVAVLRFQSTTLYKCLTFIPVALRDLTEPTKRHLFWRRPCVCCFFPCRNVPRWGMALLPRTRHHGHTVSNVRHPVPCHAVPSSYWWLSDERRSSSHTESAKRNTFQIFLRKSVRCKAGFVYPEALTL